MVDRSYSFKEISSLTNIKPYVLRFWESEFDQINPKLDQLGEKNYSEDDVNAIRRIKELLFEQKLSIPEAKMKFYVQDETSENLTHKSNIDTELNSFEYRALYHVSPVEALNQISEMIGEIKNRNGWN